jgi:hypothetical protein
VITRGWRFSLILNFFVELLDLFKNSEEVQTIFFSLKNLKTLQKKLKIL